MPFKTYLRQMARKQTAMQYFPLGYDLRSAFLPLLQIFYEVLWLYIFLGCPYEYFCALIAAMRTIFWSSADFDAFPQIVKFDGEWWKWLTNILISNRNYRLSAMNDAHDSYDSCLLRICHSQVLYVMFVVELFPSVCSRDEQLFLSQLPARWRRLPYRYRWIFPGTQTKAKDSFCHYVISLWFCEPVNQISHDVFQ